jgi:hypothetical protein
LTFTGGLEWWSGGVVDAEVKLARNISKYLEIARIEGSRISRPGRFFWRAGKTIATKERKERKRIADFSRRGGLSARRNLRPAIEGHPAFLLSATFHSFLTIYAGNYIADKYGCQWKNAKKSGWLHGAEH